MLDRAAALVEAVQVTLAPLDLPASSGHPKQRALVGPRHRPDAEDRGTVAGQVPDLEVGVGKGLPKALHHQTVTLRATRRAWQGVAINELWRRDRVDHVEVASVEGLLPERAYAPFEVYARCARERRPMYGGGMGELGVAAGRSSRSPRCSTSTRPTTWTPSAYNEDDPPSGLPASPLAARPAATGFRWTA
jgi:hypothetical protein